MASSAAAAVSASSTSLGLASRGRSRLGPSAISRRSCWSASVSTLSRAPSCRTSLGDRSSEASISRRNRKKGCGSGQPSAAPDILSGAREMVERVRELMDQPEFEIYAALENCNLEVHDAIDRLMSQDKCRWESIMGISKVIGSVATVLFAAFLSGFLLAYLVTFATNQAVNFPLILEKGSDGSFPLWLILLFDPFLMFVRAYVLIRKLKSMEPVFNEISDGLYVGGGPSSPNQLPPGKPAVIDCTCELPRSSFDSKGEHLTIATWDTRSPQPLQIESAVRWACKKRTQNNPIYIHCAFGTQMSN